MTQVCTGRQYWGVIWKLQYCGRTWHCQVDNLTNFHHNPSISAFCKHRIHYHSAVFSYNAHACRWSLEWGVQKCSSLQYPVFFILSPFNSRKVLILTLSILPAMQECISWYIPWYGLMMREWPYTALSRDVLGWTSLLSAVDEHNISWDILSQYWRY